MFIELGLINRAEAPLGAQYHSVHFAPNGAKSNLNRLPGLNIRRLRRLREALPHTSGRAA
jgi:hypothetical protein